MLSNQLKDLKTAQIMNAAEVQRAEDLIKQAGLRALNKIKKQHDVYKRWGHHEIRSYFEEVFNQSILKCSNELIAAARVKPSRIKTLLERKAEQKSTRKKLSDDLKAARAALRKLNYEINNISTTLEKEKREARKQWAVKLLSAKKRIKNLKEMLEKHSLSIGDEWLYDVKDSNKYPAIPQPTYEPSVTGENLPYVSGIYFLWDGPKIVYVGQAKYLCNRLRLGNHHILQSSHKISFVVVNRKELTWTECYYIGVCKPQLNFGRSASHYQPSVE